MRKWNWTLFVVALAISNLGALANPNFETTGIALIFGTAFGILFGLPMAYITRED